SADPLEPKDFYLAPGSPARDSGVVQTVFVTDFEDKPRPPSPGANWDQGAFQVATVASLPSLLAWWKFEEGSGTTAADNTCNGHTGTLTNGATDTTGRV